MGLFSDAGELERRANLKKFEDKRLALAQRLTQQGFSPETMLFSQSDHGGFVAIGRYGGKCWLIVSPDFGSDDDYIVETFDHFTASMEEVHVKAEGMGGMFGFGKKGEHGVQYLITRQDGSQVPLAFVSARNAWAEYTAAKNPLLKTRRRRGDTSLVWDLKPVTPDKIKEIMTRAESYLK